MLANWKCLSIVVVLLGRGVYREVVGIRATEAEGVRVFSKEGQTHNILLSLCRNMHSYVVHHDNFGMS